MFKRLLSRGFPFELINSKKEASFAAISSKTGYIKSYELGKEITSISLSNANPIIGARIYFFIVDSSGTVSDGYSVTIAGAPQQSQKRFRGISSSGGVSLR